MDVPRNPAGGLPVAVDFGRAICGELAAAESREWLVTNGIGGFGMGTIAGHQTRSYHGLLTAALDPPVGRVLLLAKLEETAQYKSRRVELGTNRWRGGAVSPEGYRQMERFHLEGTTPVWTFAFEDALLEKRVFMRAGANATYVLYRLVRAGGSVELSIKVLADYCAEHCTTSAGDLPMQVELFGHGLRVTANDAAVPYYLLSGIAEGHAEHQWYRNFDLAEERARGLRDHADHLYAGEFRATLQSGESLGIVATTDPSCSLDGEAQLELCHERERALLEQFFAANPSFAAASPPSIRQMVLAADQFIVRRSAPGGKGTREAGTRDAPDDSEAHAIIAGYPWFGEWGRDTMIALPGLTLVTGRPDVARSILRRYSRLVSHGMLPNNFPVRGAAPAYNTVDAALWYIQAVRAYFEATGDAALLRELFPVLAGIVDSYVRGTRFHIHVDSADGLLYAGELGAQLTWMDAKIGDYVVTPRMGKPVEVNALWLNAAVTMAEFARVLGQSARRYEEVADRARAGFARFWNAEREFCFDVIDVPDDSGEPDGHPRNDASLRPNQIFAVSLSESPLTTPQQRSVVNACARELLTSHGLRSLGPEEPGYRGRYGGTPEERDAAYHQGTVWGWLIGPFALAHLRVYQDPSIAASFLQPMLQHLEAAGLGTASEIFDGDPPFIPNGCIAQAWTVGETLRAWRAISMAQIGPIAT